jgi:hypothetical protein
MIWATQLPQSPHTLLEELMVDADLDAFGRSDFWELQEALRVEQAFDGRAVDKDAWLDRQIEFVGAHRYFSDVARARNDATKARHVAMLKEQRDARPSSS